MGCAWLTGDTCWEHSCESQAMAGGNLRSPLSRVGNKMKGSQISFSTENYSYFSFGEKQETSFQVLSLLYLPPT